MDNLYKLLYLICLISICIALLIYWIKFNNNIKKNNKGISRRKPSALQNIDKQLDVNIYIYEPNFILEDNDNNNNNNFLIELSKGMIKFDLLNNLNKQTGLVRSKKKYKSISSIMATIDLTKLTNLNYISTSLFLINEAKNSKINILETNGNKVFQTSVDLNSSKSDDLHNWNFELTNLVNIVDPTNEPFNIKLDFIYGQDPQIVIYAIQNDESGIIYRENINIEEITQLMSEGYWLCSSFTQKYIPSNKIDNNISIGSWEISDIKIRGKQA